MSEIKSDIRKRTYSFSLEIIQLMEKFPEKRVFWVIEDQLIRASTSIGANLVEAKAASSKKDFIKFYQISLKSANETEYWLNLLRDSFNLETKEIEKLLIEVNEISKIIAASLLTMKGKR